MDKKKLESFKKRLETRQQTCAGRSPARRLMDVPPTKIRPRISPIAPPVPTPKSFSSARATTSGSSCKWWIKLWPASAKAALASAFIAGKRSTPSGWKPCPGRGTASSARRNSSRDCWKKLRASWLGNAISDFLAGPPVYRLYE